MRLYEGKIGTTSVQIIPACMLLLLCQSYQDRNTLCEQNRNTGTTASFPTTNGNKKVSDAVTQQKTNCCDQICQGFLLAPTKPPVQAQNLLAKLCGVADELTLCL